MGMQNSSLEIVRFSPKWRNGLRVLFQALNENGDLRYFSPHPIDENTINHLSSLDGADLYYVLVEAELVLGYGILRGWDEGYSIPSLGIAIHPMARGKGLGKMLMCFLNILAIRMGADKVRLRVRKDNERAIKLYKSEGYILEEDVVESEYLIGFKTLSCHEN